MSNNDQLMPTCDRGDHRVAEFYWFGQYLCRQHVWQVHAKGHFTMCPWHGRYCPSWRGKHRSDYFEAKRKVAEAERVARMQTTLW